MAKEARSKKNKTIDVTPAEGKMYLNKCVIIKKRTELSQIIDKTIYGDTFKVMDDLPKNFVDLMIIDPPYNLSKNYHGNKFNETNDDKYEQYTIEWIERIIPLLKPNASVYVCCDWKSSLIIGKVLKDYFYIRNRITWQREKGRGAKNNWKNGMEDIWFVTMSNQYTFNLDAVKTRKKVIAPYKQDGKPKDWQETELGKFRDTCPSNFWNDICIPYWSMPENTEHPTQKPEKLVAKLILASSNQNDIVFDPFLGSGTTSVTAKKLKRHFVGIEQNPSYCTWAEKRLEMAEKNKSIQGHEDGIFWERNTAPIKKTPK